jgi:hypothetical protein
MGGLYLRASLAFSLLPFACQIFELVTSLLFKAYLGKPRYANTSRVLPAMPTPNQRLNTWISWRDYLCNANPLHVCSLLAL